MTLLVKLGGTLLDAEDSRQRLAGEIQGLAKAGHRVIVVHGGGKQMTRYLEAQGVESRFVGGLRVSSPEVIDALVKVVAGTVNKHLVAALRKAGCEAVGLSGVDGGLVEATRIREELGAVGHPEFARPAVLRCLLDGGFVPVVACVGSDSQGAIYNVNADQMACACAAGYPVEQLLFLTDVNGVLDAEKQRIPRLTVSACRQLIADGVASGGMQAKLEAACRTLEAGVGTIRILPGLEPGVMEAALRGEAVGTAIVPDSLD